MAWKKEVHFFDDENAFSKPYIIYSRYEKYFDFLSNKKIYGEVTPSYLYWTSSCRRIWEYNPQMKLIFILRDPTTRAFSDWNMEVDRKIETLDFLDSIYKERERNQRMPFLHGNFSYLTKGFYAEQIRRYKRYFPDNQMLFVKYEDFKNQQEITLYNIFEFLDVDPHKYNFQYKSIHKRPRHGVLHPDNRKYLINIFHHNIKDVEKLLNWDCSDWLSVTYKR